MIAKIAVIIPARFGSTRFPGKPLQMLGDKTVLGRVVEVARQAVAQWPHAKVAVATDDDRIAAHAKMLGVEAIMTPSGCATGTDRVFAAAEKMNPKPEIVVNLQGDAPFTPVVAVRDVVSLLARDPSVQVATPVVPLSWTALDELRENKKTTPHSGTTAIVAKDGRAIWFSKAVLPVIRGEEALRQERKISPVLRHLGLYGYRTGALSRIVKWPEGHYEGLERLEQLRMLENGLDIHTVTIDDADNWALGGIDTPEDLDRANRYLKDKL